MSASREVDDGVATIVKTNMVSFPPSSNNCRKEMVDNSGDLLSHVGERDAGFVLFVLKKLYSLDLMKWNHD